ncbi:hypothetical protein [Desertimonas flava]|uniref:hypothetical protein n=1 Tax=Desertimonas flava TaxID=2064846 RepID=UPI0013C49038|nr:hypothetical protein [Desertimonas flava]
MRGLTGALVTSSSSERAETLADLAAAAGAAGLSLQVVSIPELETDRWSQPELFIDVVIAADSTALLAVRADIAYHNPGCAFVLVVGDERRDPTPTTCRAMREADLVVVLGSMGSACFDEPLRAPIVAAAEPRLLDWNQVVLRASSRRRAATRLLSRQPYGEQIGRLDVPTAHTEPKEA